MTFAYTATDPDRIARTIAQRFGGGAAGRVEAWKGVLKGSGADLELMRKTNEFFNRHITFSDDTVVWTQPDYWATPAETLGKGAGDCEDFAIAKYFTLTMLGLEPAKLRLTYVKAKIGGLDSNITQAHMVLTYYSTPDAEPLILDNLLGDIRPASRRPDLVPVFSFNSDGIWVPGGTQAKSSVDRLSRWKDLVSKMQAEGFEF